MSVDTTTVLIFNNTTLEQEKVATEELRQTALLYIKEIIDVLRECFLIVDSDLKVIAANELFYSTFNVKKEETEGRLIFDLGNRQWDIPELRILFTDIIPKQGVISDYQVDHTFETIGEKIMCVNAKQIGTSQMIIVAIEDVTEKTQTSLYARSLIEASLDPLVTINAAGKITDVNEGSIKVTGVPRHLLIGTDFSDYFTEPEKAREGYKLVFARGLVTDYPLTIRHKQGKLTDVLYNASVYRDAKGGVLGVFAAARDVTVKNALEKKLAEFAITQESKVVERTAQLGGKIRELEESKAKDGAILASIGDAMVVVDQEGKIIFVNSVFEELLLWKRAEIIGKRMVEIIPREDEQGITVPFEERILSLVLSGKKVTTTTTTTTAAYTTNTNITNTPVVLLPSYYYLRKDKSRFFAAGTVSPIMLGTTVIGAVEIFRDITKEKEIDKAKSEFVSLASHQLRTPTTSINWYSEMLLGEEVGPLNQKQKQYCQEIHHGNQRMIELMNALLTVSRIELGTFIIEPTLISISDIAEDVLEELQTLIIEKKLQVDKEYDSENSIIASDATLIRIVFQNLLANAVEYSQKEGVIRVAIKKTHSGIQIKIADNGCGVPPEAQGKLFLKFFRASNAQITKPDGTGLGLYIAKSIVEALGGTISFKSKEDVGTEFVVALPERSLPKE
jgi:PAS domain S-box-containing protein